jgi:hypothetical protein
VDGQIEVVGPGGGAAIRVLAQIGADGGAEARAAGVGIEPAASTGAEVTAGAGPATEAEPAVETAPETGAEVAVDTEPEADAEVAVETAAETEAPVDDHVRSPNAGRALTLPVDGAKSRRMLSRDSILLIASWVVAVATPLAGLVRGGYTGQNWYEHLLPYLSPLSVIATPLALVGLQLARSARSRMVIAIAVACTGVVPALMAAATMALSGVILQELMVELIGASLIAVLGLIIAMRAGRAVTSGPPASAEVIRVTLMGVLAGLLVILTYCAVSAGVVIAPLIIGVCAVSALLALGLLLPVQARARVVLGAVLIGLLLTVTLYTITPGTETISLGIGCLVYSVVIFFHLRPFWRALDSRGS